MCFLKTFCPQELTFNHNCFLESSSLAYTTCSATSLDTTGRQVPCNWYAMLPRLTTKKYELHIIAKSHRIHVWCIHIYIYANLGGILMVNVTIYSIHGSYGNGMIIYFLHGHLRMDVNGTNHSPRGPSYAAA